MPYAVYLTATDRSRTIVVKSVDPLEKLDKSYWCISVNDGGQAEGEWAKAVPLGIKLGGFLVTEPKGYATPKGEPITAIDKMKPCHAFGWESDKIRDDFCRKSGALPAFISSSSPEA